MKIFTKLDQLKPLAFTLIALLLSALSALPATAQQFPNKPIRIVVGSPAGALGDILARRLGQKWSADMGQPVVVDNRPGAAISIAADVVAKSSADGYSVFLTPDSAVVVNPFIYPKLPYEPAKDFRSVGLIGKATAVVVASPALGVKTAQELFALVKAQPGRINFATAGSGSYSHLVLEFVDSRLGLSMAHVPYKGTSPAIQAVVSGEVGLTIVGVVEAMPLIQAGKVVPLAATGPLAKEIFPALPLLRDFHADLDLTPWFGVFVPIATPGPVVAKLNSQLNAYLSDSAARKSLLDLGIQPSPGTPGVLDELAKADRARVGPLVKQLGITAE